MDQFPVSAWREFFESQRWYGARGRGLERVGFPVRAAACPGESSAAWALARLELDGGVWQDYQLLGPIRAEKGGIREAPEAPAFLAWLDEGVRTGEAPTRGGLVRVRRTAAGERSRPELGAVALRALGGEMSNTVLKVGETELLKVYRRVQSGSHPEVQALEWLEACRFPHVPRLLGLVELRTDRGEEAALMLMTERVEDALDLWGVFSSSPGQTPCPVSGDNGLVQLSARLGRVTGELHVALLGSPVGGDAAGPEGSPLEAALAEDLLVLEALERRLDDLDDATRSLAGRVLDRSSLLRDRLMGVVKLGGEVVATHGDYHLGQILWRPGDGRIAILDFEGEPARELASRRRRWPAVRDVGCMLRSFTYARQRSGRPASWERRIRQSFLEGYFLAVGDSALAFARVGALEEAAEAFELEKAVAEIRYELGHRPDWLALPLSGVLEILDRVADNGKNTPG